MDPLERANLFAEFISSPTPLALPGQSQSDKSSGKKPASPKKSTSTAKKPKRKTRADDTESGDDDHTKRQRRRAQNKVAAQTSRDKKRKYVESLEDQIARLTRANASLEKNVKALKAENVSLQKSVSHPSSQPQHVFSPAAPEPAFDFDAPLSPSSSSSWATPSRHDDDSASFSAFSSPAESVISSPASLISQLDLSAPAQPHAPTSQVNESIVTTLVESAEFAPQQSEVVSKGSNNMHLGMVQMLAFSLLCALSEWNSPASNSPRLVQGTAKRLSYSQTSLPTSLLRARRSRLLGLISTLTSQRRHRAGLQTRARGIAHLRLLRAHRAWTRRLARTMRGNPPPAPAPAPP